jgi:hypothetical protein
MPGWQCKMPAMAALQLSLCFEDRYSPVALRSDLFSLSEADQSLWPAPGILSLPFAALAISFRMPLHLACLCAPAPPPPRPPPPLLFFCLRCPI